MANRTELCNDVMFNTGLYTLPGQGLCLGPWLLIPQCLGQHFAHLTQN